MEACTKARLPGRDLDERRLRQRHRRHRHHSRQHDTSCRSRYGSTLSSPDRTASPFAAADARSDCGHGIGAGEVLGARSAATGAVGPDRRTDEGLLRIDAGLRPVAGEPWREARHGVRREPQARPAVAPRHDPAARSGNRRAAGDHGRPLHHRGAHRGGVGGVDAVPGQARRVDARDHRQRRAGAQPSRGVSARPAVEAGAHLVAEAAEPRTVRRRHERPRADPDRRRRYRRSGGARRRSDRARDLVTDAGDRRCVGVEGRARRVRRRVPAESAGDAAGARRAQPPVCRFEGRRRRRIRRHRHEHRRRSCSTSRTFAARSASSCSAASPAARPPTTSPCSNRSAWRSKTSSPPTSCFAAPRNPEQERS